MTKNDEEFTEMKRMSDWIYDHLTLGIFLVILAEDLQEFAKAKVGPESWLAGALFIGAQMLAGYALGQYFDRKQEKIRSAEVKHAMELVEEAQKRLSTK